MHNAEAPDVGHLTSYLKCAAQALPRVEESWITRLLRLINRPPSPEVVRIYLDHIVPKKSGRFTFTSEHRNWKIHFVAYGDFLVLLVADDETEHPLEARVTSGDPSEFSANVLKAFHGYPQPARLALDTLVETIELSSSNHGLAH